ncbi:MAG: CDP-alcohol phosphatidyltransferase family protein [Candidatus Omnitrophica bacterium]|nr:CDP-alcohol phosphatidyltransferase family protein [Candidatus Omnitrophota bacterium]
MKPKADSTTLEKVLARLLPRKSINPHYCTAAVPLFGLIAGWLFGRGALRAAGVFVLVSGLFDLLDGAMARKYQRVTRFGAFFDSVCDRYAEFFIYTGIGVYSFGEADSTLLILTFLLAMGAFVTSYTRARSEPLGVRCAGGWVRRPERVILLGLGAFFYKLYFVMWILALLSNLTALQRVVFVYRALEEKQS